MKLPIVETQTDSRTRWFGPFACVVHGQDLVEVFVSGLLIGDFEPKDVFSRNLLLVGLSKEPSINKGLLARSFEVSDNHRRRVCKIAEEQGPQAIPGRPRGGSEPKLDGDARDKVLKLFAEGQRPVRVYRDQGKKLGISYTTILRMHQSWSGREREEAPKEAGEKTPQLSLVSDDALNSDNDPGLPSSGSGGEELSDDEGVVPAPIRGGKMVRHAGGLLLVAMIASFGLYEAAMKGWTASGWWRDRLRMAIDAVILALGIGQKCVEGVRRLETPTAPILLRTNHSPSESWVRRIIKRYVDGSGMANKLHLRMTGVYVDSARSTDDVPAVFYVDNHMRSYTGKHTLRKGWRMQDKRAVPGITDYYVHDEDGRPVFRVDTPSHDSLTDWLSPIAKLLCGGLEKGQRILLAFDRAGAFPENMANLRNTNVEFVTYERKPYRSLSKSAFTEEVTMEDGEVFLVHEKRLANLGKKRGRVRRISLLTEEGSQINLLAVSEEPAWRLIEIITGRWVQENGFKHGKERWGFNQLDRRKVLDYDPATIIPNPARRRLDFSFKLVDEREGKLRNKLARINAQSPKFETLNTDLQTCVALKAEMKTQRPSMPKHIALKDSELTGELTFHDPHYKTVIDTIRIACANAESDLALDLAGYLRRPLEAKKILSNIFNSPGDIRVNPKSITISLHLTGRKDERKSIDQLFQKINDRKLTLPGDAKSRPLRFKSNI